MWYNIDFKKLTVLHLPTFWRRPDMISWMQSLISPIEDLQYRFMQNRSANIKIMQNTGQVCYLKAVLNDEFDRSQRRIQIIDGNKYQRQYIYTRGELDTEQKYLGTISLYQRSDYGDTGVDFIVLLPKGLEYNEQQMLALINLYRLGSKRCKIEISLK